jgi:predicted RNA-binding protein with PUA-like domain
MAYWLVKSEPNTWSWDQQVKAGKKGTGWDGVRNAQASNFMKEMKQGDHCFFYHSGDEKQIVGIVEVIKEYHPDPADETGKYGMVDVAAVAPLPTPVTLKQVKADPAFKDLLLVRHSRISVSPVDPTSWAMICKMGGVKA